MSIVALLPASLAQPAAAATEGCLVFPPAAAGASAPTSETLAGRPVLRSLPPHLKGVVYLFHGTGGSERFALRVQTARVLAQLEAAGYGWVSAPSADRADPIRWKVDDASPASNPDIAYMIALHRALIARGEIAASTPLFTMGMSNGGAFANLFAAAAKQAGLPVAAVADYMGPFPAAMRPLIDRKAPIPTFVVVSRNDGYVATDRILAFAEELARDGAQVETHLNPERPVCADTFAVIPGLTPAAREALVSRTLVAAGVVDAEGRRTLFRGDAVITREDMQALRDKLKAALGADGENSREVANTLFVAWAAHEMRSDWAVQQVAFFDAALGRGR